MKFFITYFIKMDYGLAFVITYILFMVFAVFLLGNRKVYNAKTFSVGVLEGIGLSMGMLIVESVIYEVTQQIPTYIFMLLFLILYGYFQGRDKRLVKLSLGSVYYTSVMQILVITNSLVEYLRSLETIPTGPENGFDLTCILVIILLSGVYLFLNKLSLDGLSYIEYRYSVMVVIVALINFFVFIPMTRVEVYSYFAAVIALALWGIDLLAYYLFYSLSKEHSTLMDLTGMQYKVKALQDQFQTDMSLNDELKILHHELKNYILYANKLLAQGAYDELNALFSKINQDQAHVLQYYDCGNNVVNCVINTMMHKGNNNKVLLDADCQVPKKLAISDSELFSLLANLLENAIEASTASEKEKPKVSVKLFMRGAYLFVKVENDVANHLIQEGSISLETTKDNKGTHGFGVRIVRMIVEKYQGTVEFSIKGSLFCAEAMLKPM